MESPLVNIKEEEKTTKKKKKKRETGLILIKITSQACPAHCTNKPWAYGLRVRPSVFAGMIADEM